MSKQKWQDLSTGQRAAALTLISVQLSLAATAYADLATRPAVYFTKGRSTRTSATAS